MQSGVLLKLLQQLSMALVCLLLLSCSDSDSTDSSHSVARQWNEVVLEAIRNDYARPTVHARNLFHISAAMYDAWAGFSNTASGYLLGNRLGNVDCSQTDIDPAASARRLREEAISYAAYRLIMHRFANSPGHSGTFRAADELMASLGFDPDTDQPSPAAELGRQIAGCYILYGLLDGANEVSDYANQYYQPVNPPLEPEMPGNPEVVDADRWQPLLLDTFIDQSGNLVLDAPEFLGAEWGNVAPFSLVDSDFTEYQRNGETYRVYHDPGMPPLSDNGLSDEYRWGFSLVSIWSSHLDPTDGVMIDISPASQGNMALEDLPTTFPGLRDFYQDFAGSDVSPGHTLNPFTLQPYQPQIVPRGDYARVLAEFWADGPDSETPPGHWFVILNTVMDSPEFEPRYRGSGELLDDLEWDVKAYFTLGGAMHDAAIAAWSIKGWYDYIRPASAIRAMADQGQSSDPLLPNYSSQGIPLVPGYIELVAAGDPLAGANDEHVGKIRLYAWRGPDYITNPRTQQAGVGWILAENWWPYQRPSFVTPPFAGYVSGHSTYSRAAAEVLTLLTGSEYFPGGLGRFPIPANAYLVFEQGPSVDLELQWATYQDASDQCSLSRIWGGIHPPADDIAGRLIGARIGETAFAMADSFFGN